MRRGVSQVADYRKLSSNSGSNRLYKFALRTGFCRLVVVNLESFDNICDNSFQFVVVFIIIYFSKIFRFFLSMDANF